MIFKGRKENILLTSEMGLIGINEAIFTDVNIGFFIDFRLKYYTRVYNKNTKSMSFRLKRSVLNPEDYDIVRRL